MPEVQPSTGNYRQTQAEALKWRRSPNVSIFNPLDGVPVISFAEEDVVQIDGKKIVQPAMSQVQIAFDPELEIQLRDIETGELTGEVVTALKLYQILQSTYIQGALARDAREAQPDPLAQMPEVPEETPEEPAPETP